MRNKNKQLRENKFALLSNLPMASYLLLILLVPMLWGIYISFTNKRIGNEASFIGFENYLNLLQNPNYLRSLMNTVIFTVSTITLKLFFGTIMALALNGTFKGRNIVRALLMIPWTIPNIVVVLNWRWIFSSTGGLANTILDFFNIADGGVVWFGSSTLAMLALIIANVWRGTAFFGVSILAKLQTIPKDYYEVALIDGANAWERFRYITFPEIKGVMLLSTLMSTIWTINEFETVWLLTGGGPNGSTEVMNVFSYKTAMVSQQIGLGVTVSILAMPVLLLLIHFISKILLENQEEGA